MGSDEHAAHEVEADYFDGRSAKPRRVRLVARAGELRLLAGDASTVLTLRASQLRWPERTRHGARVAHLSESAGGGELHAIDGADWDRFAAAAGARESVVVRSQQSWRGVLVALVLLLAVIGAGWRWGVPAAAQAVVALVPHSVDAEIGAAAYEEIEQRWLKPSAVPPERQAALRAALTRALERAEPGGVQPWRLEFHASRIGPNAFALPGGIVVLTDELFELVEGDEAMLVGVLAHEYGHVKARHGMRQVVQAGALGAVASLVFGDFSGLLASLPVLLGTLAYSRDFEREADETSIAVLRADGRSPAAMVGFFDKLATQRKERDMHGSALGIAFSSHPADAERIARFQAAAQQR